MTTAIAERARRGVADVVIGRIVHAGSAGVNRELQKRSVRAACRTYFPK